MMNEQDKKDLSRLRKLLFDRGDFTPYVVLDGASVPNLLTVLESQEPDYICLYRGEIDEELAEVAPYLVKLEPETVFSEFVFEGWGQHWGIFALSEHDDIRVLRKHFRTFLMVYDPEGKPLYFRYYDPRVLRVYLPTCNNEDNKVLFAYVNEYLMENEDPNFIIKFALEGNDLQQKEILL